MRRDRRGVALVFDALAFLTIIAIVAVAMMQLVRIESNVESTDVFVEEVHRAVLSTSYRANNGATPMSLLDALRTSFSTGNVTLREQVLEQMEDLFIEYLEPEHRFLWTIEHDGYDAQIGWDEISSIKASLYVSKVDASTAGSGTTMRLIVSH